MGIKSLMKLLHDEAPEAITEKKIKTYSGKLIAIDASTQLYQYFAMLRIADSQGQEQNLQSSDGRETSHISGFFNRTIKLMENGIKPVYVFDGKPPELKFAELKKRKALKVKAENELKEVETVEEYNKINKRTIRVTKEHNEEVKNLLRLMGVPVIESPGEAEAGCAKLCESGKVNYAASSDMDTLTFGTPILLRHLTFSPKHKTIQEINYDKVLECLGLSPEEFIDLCILCGCDFSESIKGVGPKSAYKLIKKYRVLEDVFEHIKKNTKYTIPEDLEENLDEIRNIFMFPDVLDSKTVDIKFSKPDEEGIKEYLKELDFNDERVLNAIERLKKSYNKNNQKSIGSFFKKK